MAIAIKQIPTLTGENAKSFEKMAENAFNKKKATIDFSKEAEAAKRILKNAKI